MVSTNFILLINVENIYIICNFYSSSETYFWCLFYIIRGKKWNNKLLWDPQRQLAVN